MSVGVTRDARQIAFALEVKSAKIFENIFLQNGVLAKMGLNKRVKVRRGGNRFDERIHLGQNSNVQHRSKFGQIDTDFQNNWFTAEYGQAVLSGAAIVNQVEVDQAQGTAKLDDIAEKSVEEAQNTFPNITSDGIMASSSAANGPVSIVEEIEATAFGSQSGSLGGILREDHTGLTDKTDAWQNQFLSTNISDVGSAAGIASITKFAWECSPGGSALTEQPDIALTTTGVFAKFSGGGDGNRRFNVDSKLLKLGFDNIMVNRAAVMADRNVASKALYFLNTNYMRLQVLAGPKTKTIGSVQTVGDGKQSLPLQVRPAIESADFLNFVIKLYLVYNLTFGGLRQHGLANNITEA